VEVASDRPGPTFNQRSVTLSWLRINRFMVLRADTYVASRAAPQLASSRRGTGGRPASGRINPRKDDHTSVSTERRLLRTAARIILA
jgi:hypothetical protein